MNRLVRGDGNIADLEETAQGFFDGEGRLIRLLGIVADVSERNHAEEQLKALNETLEHRVAERTAESRWRANQLQKLAAQMAQAEERERRRLSQVLHDGLQQVLVAAKMRLASATLKVTDAQAAAKIKEAANLIDESIAESRSLTRELSPPVLYDGGLAAGLEWLGRETEKKYQLPVTVIVDQAMEPDDLTTKVFVFQAARELILNAVKHAHAFSLKVFLSSAEGDRLQVVIADDGIGFDSGVVNKKEGGGFGLFSIKERLEVIGGEFRIASSPLEGTMATIIAPCRRPRPAEASVGPAVEPIMPPTAAPTRTNRIRVLLADDHPLLRKGIADIGLSMHDTEDMVAKMKDAGANDYLTKTVGLEEMIAAIMRVCPRR